MGSKKALLFTSGYRYTKNNGTNVGDVAQFENAVLLLRENFNNITIVAVAHSLSNECTYSDIPLSTSLSEYVWGGENKTILGRIGILSRTLKLLLNAERMSKGKKCLFIDEKAEHALEEIRDAGFLFYAGAGTLNSKYMLGPAYILLLAMLLARSLHTPYILIGQQIGPLDTWLSRWVFSIALKGASFIGVRDRSSESLLERLGVDPDKRMFTGDEGFYLPPIDGEKVEEYLREMSIPQGYIAVQFRLDANSPFHDRVADFARLYDDIAISLGKPLVFVPFSYADRGDDRETHRLIAKAITAPHFLLDVEGNARFTKAIMAKASLAVGVANHFCAFAASVGVPTIGIHATPYMTQKLDGLVQGRPYVLSIPVSELDDHNRLAETIVAHANRYVGMKRVDYFNERPQGYDSWLAPITAQV